MRQGSPTPEAPGRRSSNDRSPVQHAAAPGKRTLCDALPAAPAPAPTDAAANTAARPGAAGAPGSLPTGPRPSLQRLFGPPAAQGDAGGPETVHAAAARGIEGS